MIQKTFWDDYPADLGGGASRRDDPDTSHQAGGDPKFAPGRNSMAFFVLTLHLLHDDGMTDEELESCAINRVYDASHRKRRSDLAKNGYLEDTGERRTTITGSGAIVWRITQKGRDYIDRKNAQRDNK
jgi:hypothetical protein